MSNIDWHVSEEAQKNVRLDNFCIIYRINAPTNLKIVTFNFFIWNKEPSRTWQQQYQYWVDTYIHTSIVVLNSVNNDDTGGFTWHFAFDHVSTLRHHVQREIHLEIHKIIVTDPCAVSAWLYVVYTITKRNEWMNEREKKNKNGYTKRLGN